ncbi:MAG: hypothetical protein ACRD63_08770 [Pyrinomonadaceae bacterium]
MELFRHHQVETGPPLKRFLLLVSASLILHLSFVLGIVYIPAFSQVIRLAGLFPDSDYVSEDYQHARIRERATILDLRNYKRFEYPPQYFTGRLFVDSADSTVSAVSIVKPSPTQISKLRKRSKDQEKTDVKPDANSAQQKDMADNPANQPQLSDKLTDSEAQKALNKQAEATGIKLFPKINTKPFKDLLVKASELKNQGNLDLSGMIEMTIEADRNVDGTLDNIEISDSRTSDPRLKEVANEFIIALSASGVLARLEDVKHLRLKLSLDQDDVNIAAETLVDSEARASEMARGFSGLLFIEKIRKRGQVQSQFIEKTKVQSSGRQLIVSLAMSRAEAGSMITKYIPPS